MSEDHGVFAPPLPGVVAGRPKHGQTFTALLIALGLLCVVMIGQFFAMVHNPAIVPESQWVYYYIIWVQTVYLLAIIAALLVRGFFPSMRRVATMAVSYFLLLHFPLGTAVGIYGLKKVDLPIDS